MALADSGSRSQLRTKAVQVVSRASKTACFPQLSSGKAVRAMKLGQRIQFYKVPGVSVAFFDHGKIIWTRAYGLADMAAKKPVTSETLFQSASISKPVSALAALHLVQEGKLRLDGNVNDKLRA
jgi:CubicO group peptidase (beta-lactamase class C family)